MIRTSNAKDEQKIIEVATRSGLFENSQAEELKSMLADFHQEEETHELWLVDDQAGEIVSIAYLAPERMTHGTWNLFLIAVHPEYQRRGFGVRMLKEVISLLKERGERMLLVETSGTSEFDYVREFYKANGFNEEAKIREFYESGVDRIIEMLEQGVNEGSIGIGLNSGYAPGYGYKEVLAVHQLAAQLNVPTFTSLLS